MPEIKIPIRFPIKNGRMTNVVRIGVTKGSAVIALKPSKAINIPDIAIPADKPLAYPACS